MDQLDNLATSSRVRRTLDDVDTAVVEDARKVDACEVDACEVDAEGFVITVNR